MKKIQADISFASLRAAKLNFPILMARVFSKEWRKSRKFSRSFWSTK